MDTNLTVHITRTSDWHINETLPSENRKRALLSEGFKIGGQDKKMLHLIGNKIREEVQVQETRPIETPDNFLLGK